MLILTRNVSQSIMIGDEVKVTITAIQGGQVKLGIEAPRDVSVHREEVFERILREEQKEL